MGALLLIAAGTLSGFMESHKLTVRVEKLEAFLRFLSAARTEIRYSAAPVVQILMQHGSEIGFLRQCSRFCSEGSGFVKAWENAVNSRAKLDGFSPRDRELLLSFGAGFGASDTDGQISHLELYANLIGENLKTAKENQGRKSKLYLMLGVFAGLGTAILLC